MTLFEAHEAVRSGDSGRNHVINFLYKNSKLKTDIRNYFVSHGATHHEVDDLYIDCIIQTVKTLFNKTILTENGPIEPYVFGVSRFLWYAELRRRKGSTSLENISEFDKSPDSFNLETLFLNDERKSLLKNILLKLRNKCQQVLMYWANDFSMKEIALMLNYQSEGMARKKKSQCLYELINFLNDNPNLKSQLWN